MSELVKYIFENQDRTIGFIVIVAIILYAGLQYIKAFKKKG